MYAAKRFKSKYDPATFFARLKSYCQLDDNPVITLSTNTMGDVYTVSLTTKGVFAPQSGLPLYGDLFHNRMKVNIAKDKVAILRLGYCLFLYKSSFFGNLLI